MNKKLINSIVDKRVATTAVKGVVRMVFSENLLAFVAVVAIFLFDIKTSSFQLNFGFERGDVFSLFILVISALVVFLGFFVGQYRYSSSFYYSLWRKEKGDAKDEGRKKWNEMIEEEVSFFRDEVEYVLISISLFTLLYFLYLINSLVGFPHFDGYLILYSLIIIPVVIYKMSILLHQSSMYITFSESLESRYKKEEALIGR